MLAVFAVATLLWRRQRRIAGFYAAIFAGCANGVATMLLLDRVATLHAALSILVVSLAWRRVGRRRGPTAIASPEAATVHDPSDQARLDEELAREDLGGVELPSARVVRR
jgi:hypothetical protein